LEQGFSMAIEDQVTSRCRGYDNGKRVSINWTS
jgi:hypothetical protein